MSSRLSPQSSRRRKWRGKRWELELVELLRSHGWQARRAALSGQGRLDCDVLALKPDVLVAFECKSSQKGMAPIKRGQVEKLRETLDFYGLFHRNAQLLAVLGIKFPHRGKVNHIFIRLTAQDLEENKLSINRKLSNLKKELDSGEISQEHYRERAKSVNQEDFLKVYPSAKSNWQP